MSQEQIQRHAEEQVLMMLQFYRMSPQEIVESYTGETVPMAHYADAVRVVEQFNRHCA